MPAVKGEFYNYRTLFSTERPLFFLLKCKSSKARPLTAELRNLVHEFNLTFVFGPEVMLCSPDSAQSLRLLEEALGDVGGMDLLSTEIRLADIPEGEFHDCLESRDPQSIIGIYNRASSGASTMPLSEGMVLAVKSRGGKYGILLIEELTGTSCVVHASHVLI